MRFGVLTLGCKVNQYESNEIISELIARGHEATALLKPADVYIINTCSITSEADKKSRQMVARALRHNAEAKVIIMGCSSEKSPKPYEQKQQVSYIIGATDKTRKIIELVESLEREQEERVSAKDTFSQEGKTRAYLKIQDGCDNFCSYCIVPYLRGRSRSRDLCEVVDEATRLAQSTQEIVITGINVSDYKSEGRGLSDLVSALGAIPARKRFSSLECGVINESFLKRMKEAGFCDHFHLSLQSGSNEVLRSMNRHYTKEEFFEKTQLIYNVFPYAGITTDIITGFPEEGEENHIETLEFIKKVGFSDIHIFPYSVREGTVAAGKKQVDKRLVERRASELNALKREQKLSFYEKNKGRVLEVYSEDEEAGYNVGYTENYIKVYSNAKRHSLTPHLLTDIKDINGMLGSVVNRAKD